MINFANPNDDAGRDRRAARSRDRQVEVADIGDIPAVVNAERKAACRLDLKRFLVEYFPHSTGLTPLSADHDKVVARMQNVVLNGGRQCNVVYRGFAKALALDTPLPTPNGWTTMGEVSEGDTLFDDQGNPCRVDLATEVMTGKMCYRVSFDDGESVVCSEDHLWTVDDGYLRRTDTLTTAELAKPSAAKMNRLNRYSIANPEPLRTFDAGVPIVDPYVLGFWLGDGTSADGSVTIGDLDADESISQLRDCGEVVVSYPKTRRGNAQRYGIGAGHRVSESERIATLACAASFAAGASIAEASEASGLRFKVAAGVKCGRRAGMVRGERASLRTRLREIGVLSNKHIPQNYLRRPETDRWAMLQGLMDTDGTVSKSGHCSYCTKLPELRDGVRELLASLGIKSTVGFDVIKERTYWKVNFTCYSDRPCFRLHRKASRLRPRKSVSICSSRRITAIDEVPSVPVRCIQVDSPSRLYLCGRSMIPTHNTTISENTALWATLYGHRKFVPIFGADSGAAERIIDSIKLELETNDLLYEDFPEVCHAIRALEGKPQRQHSQHLHGSRTFIEFTAATVVLPTIEGSIASGAVLTAHGLTGAARGLKHKRADGVNLRPDLVLLDDIQTDESAKTPAQNDKRLKIIRKSILRMAGHRTGLAVILNGTIIEADDAVDQLSDPTRTGSFQSERIPMIRKWADAHDSFWMLEYSRTRRTFDPEDVLGKQEAERAATALYVANRDMADAGCEVSWQSCFDEDCEVSAIQHAYNILIDDGPDVFASECQNNPTRRESENDAVEVNPIAVAMRTNGLPRGVSPLSATSLTIHIDVQHSLLYWSALACDTSLTGSIIDYRTFPEQNSAYFALREATRTLAIAYPGLNPQEAVEQGLSDLVAHLVNREWLNENKTPIGVGLILIDWSDGDMADVIAKVCRTSPYKALLMPAAGVGIGPNKAPMMLYTPSQGETLGNHWIKKRNQKHAVMAVRVDTNYWKARAATALTCPKAMRGAISLYGTNGENGNSITDHRMVADHFSSEKGSRLKNEDSGRVVTVFDLKPNRQNHYWDNLVGAMVAASMKGCGNDDPRKKDRIKLSDIQGKRR